MDNNNKASFSPTPRKEGKKQGEDTMDFSRAIAHVVSGKKIHKLEWVNKGFYGFLKGDVLHLHKPDGSENQWILNQGDIIGKDYILV